MVDNTYKLNRKKERLELYYKMEEEILTGRAKAYSIGSRNLTRYDAQLSEVRAMIDKLENEIETLEGRKTRKAQSVIPCDY